MGCISSSKEADPVSQEKEAKVIVQENLQMQVAR